MTKMYEFIALWCTWPGSAGRCLYPALVLVPGVHHCEGVLTDVLTLLLCREHIVGVGIGTVRPQERFTFPGSSVVKVEHNRGDFPGGTAAELDRGNFIAVCIKIIKSKNGPNAYMLSS